MIRLSEGRFTDILPENLAGQIEAQAFAYALGRQVEKLCAYADGTRIYAAVNTIPERVLDILAIELRTPAYREQFPPQVKRALIEGTLTFYTQMGTPAAVNRIMEIIFEAGHIEEWYEYGGKAHHFRAHIGYHGGAVGPEELGTFRRVLSSVKRLSAWMDGIYISSAELQAMGGVAGVVFPGAVEVTLARCPVGEQSATVRFGGMAVTSSEAVVLERAPRFLLRGAVRCGGASYSMRETEVFTQL